MLETGDLAGIYLSMKEFVIGAGYDHEIDWQEETDIARTTETEFLREAAWVVLSSGFRETIVRAKFPGVSEAFLDWCSAERISACRESCERQAMSVFGNRRKICAIGKIVRMVAEDGYEVVKWRVRQGGAKYLREMPFMGPVTSYHLAKNIGIAVAKPDRHLMRMACASGRGSAMEMCEEVAKIVGDATDVVDLVFWRYATLDADYESAFGALREGCVGGRKTTASGV